MKTCHRYAWIELESVICRPPTRHTLGIQIGTISKLIATLSLLWHVFCHLRCGSSYNVANISSTTISSSRICDLKTTFRHALGTQFEIFPPASHPNPDEDLWLLILNSAVHTILQTYDQHIKPFCFIPSQPAKLIDPPTHAVSELPIGLSGLRVALTIY